MQRDDGTFRKRDKNQIKVMKKRPKNRKPSWQSKGNVSITDYNNLEIEGSSNLTLAQPPMTYQTKIVELYLS